MLLLIGAARNGRPLDPEFLHRLGTFRRDIFQIDYDDLFPVTKKTNDFLQESRNEIGKEVEIQKVRGVMILFDANHSDFKCNNKNIFLHQKKGYINVKRIPCESYHLGRLMVVLVVKTFS